MYIKIKNNHILSVVVNSVISGVIALILLVCLIGNQVIEVNAQKPKAVYRGSVEKPNVAIMFNVCWGTEYIPDILKVLDAYKTKCTFFLGGSWVDDNNALAKQIAQSGHEIGNHGYHHKDHSTLSEKQNEEEIIVSEKLIQAVCGVKTRFFAPPSGAYSSTTINVATQNGYTVVMWSKDTIDWRDKDSNVVFSRATSGISNGELILMHPTQHTLKALPNVLEALIDKGFCPTIVSNVIITTLEM